jgi:hypothetical protein
MDGSLLGQWGELWRELQSQLWSIQMTACVAVIWSCLWVASWRWRIAGTGLFAAAAPAFPAS